MASPRPGKPSHLAACDAESVAAAVGLVWHNCQLFNEQGSDIDQLRAKAQQAFEQAWLKAQLPLHPEAQSTAASRAQQLKASAEVCSSCCTSLLHMSMSGLPAGKYSAGDVRYCVSQHYMGAQ